MKKITKTYIYTLMLWVILLAMSSCRTSRQSSVEYTDTSTVSVIDKLSTLSKDEILSLISASREMALSGIKVEFFPPDSVHPNSRAAPKSLTIENVKAKESVDEATHATAAVEEQETVNLSAQYSSEMQQDTRSDTCLFIPPDWVLLFSILSAIIIISIMFIFKAN